MFWCKTISGNDFTPHCVFGCAWKIKFSEKTFQLTVCFMALTRKLVYIFIFTTNHFRVSDAQREREKEERVTDPPKTDRNPAPVPPAPQHWRHHISRTTTEIASPSKIDPPKSIAPRLIHRRSHHPRLITPTEIASPSKTDSPKTDLIGATVTHDRSHRPLVVTHDRSRRSLDLVSISSLPKTELVSISLPMTHDQSLSFPPFLITLSSSLSQFD